MFASDARFLVIRRLGEGGMGVVYEVDDKERGERVALKALNHVDARAIYGLKREFRSLAEVRHPNIVRLHELGSRGDEWYFTMELVHGEPFSRYVKAAAGREGRGSLRLDAFPAPLRSAALSSSALPSPWFDSATIRDPSLGTHSKPPAARVFDELKLRAALEQLVIGVGAIHRAGRLHRDLKPSNVLVTREGRVVILDFGLIQDAPALGGADSVATRELIVGTPAFMAPEQAAAERAEEASDWYAVGVMLYLSLTGRLPFEGRVQDVLQKKREQTPDAPSTLVAGIPDDLDQLCVRLLATSPKARPTTAELHGLLGISRPSSAPTPGGRPSERARLVGRTSHLEVLGTALAASRAGAPVLVTVTGDRGAGKTLLVQHFLAETKSQAGGRTFSARCSEHETMPYRAFDAIVDALSGFLATQTEHQVEALLPRNTADLTRLFPVLARVLTGGGAAASLPGTEPGELRARAFAAFGELVGRLADRQPLVLHVDDAELGDADSADLICAVLLQRVPPPLLLILSYDEERFASSAFARRATELGLWKRVRHEALRVGPLPLDEGIELGLAELGLTGLGSTGLGLTEPGKGDGAWKLAQRLADASLGNPLALRRLAALAKRGSTSLREPNDFLLPGSARAADLLLAALGGELEAAPEAVRLVLSHLALCDGRVRFDALCNAAGVAEGERWQILEELRGHDWVQLVSVNGHDGLELRQPELRAVALRGQDAERVREMHDRLAHALIELHPVDAGLVGEHLEAAGHADRAAAFFGRAALHAADSLAFGLAARWYERALGAARGEPPETRATWLVGLARCQAAMGRTLAASEALLAAAELVGGERGREWAREAIAYQADVASLGSMTTESVPGGENLFQGISKADVDALLEASRVQSHQSGEPVFEPGGEPSFGVVLSGAVALFAPGAASGALPIATLPAGSVLGAVPFLLEQPTTTVVRAAGDGTRVLGLSRKQLGTLGERRPELSLQLTLNLARIVCVKLANVRTKALGSKTS